MLIVSMQYRPIWLICFILGVHLKATAQIFNVSNVTQTEHRQTRIVNGYRCPIEDHPYMVSIQRTSDFQHFCGGTILSDSWILTAAHCCKKDYKNGTFSAVAGRSILRTSNGQRQLIVRNYIHSQPYYNDICLMELGYPITQTKNVRYVHLANYLFNQRPISETCREGIAIGWGVQYAKDENGKPLETPIPPHDPHLQCAVLPIIDKPECERRFGFKFPPTVICTYAKDKSACQKDSGGPLMCNDVQYGIVSFGIGCAYGGYPEGFTRVDVYETFIRRVVLRSKELPCLCKRANWFIIIFSLCTILPVKVLLW